MMQKDLKTERKKRRTRLKIRSLTDLPRLSVFRSQKYIYVQIIDNKGRILATANDLKTGSQFKRIERARQVGREIAKKAMGAKIKRVVLDRGPYKYHGRVKVLAEGAREGGLKF